MRHPLALALVLISAATASSLPRAEPLNERAPLLACPACGQINAAVRTQDGILAVGARGLIVHGTSSGGQWQQIRGPVRRMLTAITGTREGHLVAIGHDALILSSPAAGTGWAVVNADPELDTPLLDLWIGQDGRGLAVGAYGLALLTTDYGRSWSRHEIDLQETHFYSIDEAPDGNLFVCGEFGTVLKSYNRGKDWIRLDINWDGTFFGCKSGPAGRVLLYGLEGALLESPDGGKSWRHLETGVSVSLYDAAFLPDHRAIIAGADGIVLLETTAGKFERIPRNHSEPILEILVTSPDTALLFGEGGIQPLDLSDTLPAEKGRGQ